MALVAYGADSVIELIAGAPFLSRLHAEARGGEGKRVERAEPASSWTVDLALLALVASIMSLISGPGPEAIALGTGITAASSIRTLQTCQSFSDLGKQITSTERLVQN